MLVKCTALFELSTNFQGSADVSGRIGGWSESVYDVVGSFGATTVNAFRLWCEKRAGILPIGCNVVGQRYEILDPAGPSQTDSKKYSGGSSLQADVPQMALLCKMPSQGLKNFRSMILRGIPDARVVKGEYSPSQAFTNALNAFFKASSPFFMRGVNLANPAYPLYSIDAAGNFLTEEVTTLAAGDIVKVLRANTASGKQVGGKFRVSAMSSTSGGLLNGYNLGATTGGRIRKHAIIYPQMDGNNAEVSRVITKKVGRPFTQYRGRVSKGK